MKRLYFVFFAMVLSKFAVATHLRAADITFKVTSPYTIEATVTLYTKFDGVSMMADADTITVDWGDGISSTVNRSNGVDSDLNGFKDGIIVSTSPISIRKSEYTGVHLYSGLPPLTNPYFIISYYGENRIDGVVNIESGNSVDVPLYIEDTVFNVTAINSSPLFINPAVDYANYHKAYTFNSVAYDADGDSLSFELVPPLMASALSVPLYLFPNQYCLTEGDSLNSFQINNQNGQISWSSPCSVGIYVVAVLVREYRCGVLMSTVLNDMQIITDNNLNNAPLLSLASDTFINPGDSIHFAFTSSDPNVSQTVTLSAIGGAFSLSSTPPVFISTAGNPATGTFSWKPDISCARHAPYIFSIKAADNYLLPGNPPVVESLNAYQTFRVWVADTSDCFSTAVENIDNNSSISTFPNPFTHQININYNKPFEYELMDYVGRVVMKGKAERSINTAQLAVGNYLLVMKNDEMYCVKKLVKE